MNKHSVNQQASCNRILPRSRISICIASMCVASGLSAAPVAPEVMHGSADFIRQGDHLEISNSDGAIINWQDFSIAAHESVNFLQTHASSAILNRVISNIPSDILGELTSNGRVFVINPNGLVIGKDAIIDTAGFVGSTLNITDEDFIAGRMKFVGDSGEIENHGYIAAGPGGDVILIAPDIENHGVIEADDGQILLAAGREVTLHSMQSGGLSYRVSAPGDKALNIGQLVAANGSVKVFADQIFQQGDISATRATRAADGSIILEADNAIKVSGSLDAGGDGVAGGDIHVLGKQVDVEGAQINASGESGGEILIGGDYAGEGEVKNAANTNVDESTVITADAGKNGAGGRVIVWSDNTTNSFAKITAKGGELSGDGGFVETSGKKTLNFGQAVDVSANNGAAGTWLLDPEDIVIDEAGASSIETSLNGGSNVEVRTSDEGDGEGNITVAAPITKTEGDSAVTLTLDAHNRVDVNAPITTTAGPLNVDIKTGRQVASVDVSEENESLEEELQGEGDDSPEGGESVVVEEATDNEGEGEGLGEPTEATETAESDEVADQGSDQSVGEGGSVTSESDESTATAEGAESTESAEESEGSEELVAEQSDVDDGAPIDDAPEVDDSGVDGSVVEEPAVEVEEAIADVDDAPQELEEVAEQPAEEVVEEQEVAIEAEEVVTEVEEAVAEVEEVEEAVDEVVEEVVAQADEAVEESVSANQDSGFIDTQEQQIVIAADIFTGGGEVTIDAGEGGDVIIVADIDTSDHDGDLAGDITVEADNIAIVGDAEVDASDEVAGEIQIGGGQQGQDPDIDNADIVIIGEDATISADGGENGDGGRVIVFSEQASIISGNLSAQGGSQSGNGGFIETSGLQTLRVNNTPNVSAPNGDAGTWLIDPTDIEIADYVTTVNVNLPTMPGGVYADFTALPSGGDAVLATSLIREVLADGADVVIDTTGSADVAGEYGDIIFNGNLNRGDNYANILTGSLTLNAARNIEFNGSIESYFYDSGNGETGRSNLDVTFNAYADINLNAGYINPAPAVYASEISIGGTLTLNAGFDVNSGSASNIGGDIVSNASLSIGGDRIGERDYGSLVARAYGGTVNQGSIEFGVYYDSQTPTPVAAPGSGIVGVNQEISITADADVTLNGEITSNFATINVRSGGVDSAAAFDVSSSADLIAVRGDGINIDSGRDINLGSASDISASGYLNLNAARNVMTTADITLTGTDGDLTVNATTGEINFGYDTADRFNSSRINVSGDVLANASQGITLSGRRFRSTAGSVTLNSGVDQAEMGTAGHDVRVRSIRASGDINITATQDAIVTTSISSDGEINLTADRNIGLYGGVTADRVINVVANANNEFTGFNPGGDDFGVVNVISGGGVAIYSTGSGTTGDYGDAVNFSGAGVLIDSPGCSGVDCTAFIRIEGESVNIGNENNEITGDVRLYTSGTTGVSPYATPIPGVPISNLYGGIVIEAYSDLNVFTSGDITIQSSDSAFVRPADLQSNLPAGIEEGAIDNRISLTGASQELSASDITITSGVGAGATINIEASRRYDQLSLTYVGGDQVITADNLILDSTAELSYIDPVTSVETRFSGDDWVRLMSDVSSNIDVTENLSLLGREYVEAVSYNYSDYFDPDFTSAIVTYGDLTVDVAQTFELNGGEIRLETIYNPDYIGELGSSTAPDMITVGNLNAVNGQIVFNRDSDAANISYAPGELIFSTTGANSVVAGLDDPVGPLDFGLRLSSVTWNQEGTVDWQSGSIDIGAAPVAFPTYLGFPNSYDAVAHASNINNSGSFRINSETGDFSFYTLDLSTDPATEIQGTFVNTGTIIKDSGSGITNFDVTLENSGYFHANSGTIDLANGGLLQTAGETVLRGGNISVGSDGRGLAFEGGYLRGGLSDSEGVTTGGTLTSNVTVQNTTIDPGFSPGTLTIDGDFNAAGGGNTFLVDVYGSNNGGNSSYDQLIITGDATIPVSGANGANQVSASGTVDFYVDQVPTTNNSYYDTSFEVIQAAGTNSAIGDLTTDTSNVEVNVYGPGVNGTTYNSDVVGLSNTGVSDFTIQASAVVDVASVVEPPVVEPPVVEPPTVEPPTVEPPVAVEPPAVVEPPVAEEPPAVVEPPVAVDPPVVVEPPEVVVVIIDEIPVALPPEIVDVLVTLSDEERRAFLESERVRSAIRTVNMCTAEI